MKEYFEVLSEEQIKSIKERVYGNEINRSFYCLDYNIDNIAFGKFINGYCLIYVNSLQEHISRYEDSSNFHASYIIDEKGEFVQLPFDKNKKLTGISEIDKDDYNITIQRIYTKKKSAKISTDDIKYAINESLPTSYLLYQGSLLGPFDEDGGLPTTDMSGGIINIRSKERLYKGDIKCFDNILFKDRYMFLKWQFKSEEWKCEEDWKAFLVHGYSEDELADCYAIRYGLFDMLKGKIIIHCDNTGLYYVNGFRKIEIDDNGIYTYTYKDLEKGVGIKYSPRIKECSSKPSSLAVNDDTLNYECVNVVDRYNPAYSFILREGKYAGRNLLWLLIEKSMEVFKYINLNYIWFSSVSDLPFCIDDKIIKGIWLRMDMKKEFEPILDANSRIHSKDCFPLCERSLYEGKTIVDVISCDYKYIYKLVTKYQSPIEIDLQVFDVLEELWSGNKTLLNKLQNIKDYIEQESEL